VKLLTGSITTVETIILAVIPFGPAIIILIFLSWSLTIAAKHRNGLILKIIWLVLFIGPFLPSLFGGPSTSGTTPSGASLAGERKNVVLVSIDTCRTDDLGIYGSELVETPNIDDLAGTSMVFDNAITPIPMTGPSHMTMLTGLQPDPSYGHGVLNNGIVLSSGLPTLATELDKAGYRTGAVIGGSPLTREASGLHRGFHYYNDVFEDSLKSRIFPGITWSLTVSRITRKLFSMSGVNQGWLKKNAETVTCQAIDFIEDADGDNFFLFVHYYDPHTPLNPEPPYDTMYQVDLNDPDSYKDTHPVKSGLSDELKNKFEDEPLAERRALYRGEITYTDHWIGELIEYLKDQGLYDNTLIIITADHGEAFENVYIGHLNRLWETCVHVPLIVRNPDNIGLTQRYSELVNISDIFYTVLDYLDVSPGDEYISVIHSEIPGSNLDWNHNLLGVGRPYMPLDPRIQTWEFIPMMTNGIPTTNETFVGPTYGLRGYYSKMIYAPENNELLPQFQYFDLTTNPLEDRSLYGIIDDEAIGLPDAESILESWAEKTRASGSGSMDPLVRAQLEALGYAQR